MCKFLLDKMKEYSSKIFICYGEWVGRKFFIDIFLRDRDTHPLRPFSVIPFRRQKGEEKSYAKALAKRSK